MKYIIVLYILMNSKIYMKQNIIDGGIHKKKIDFIWTGVFQG